MLSANNLLEVNNAVKACHANLHNYSKIPDIKTKLQFLSTIWSPSHISKPTKYTPGIVHLNLTAGSLAAKSIPLQPLTDSSLNSPSSENQQSDAIAYQTDLSTTSGLCVQFIELHIFWLQANVDLFLQCDVATAGFSSQQILHRIYDHLILYLSAPLYTTSSISSKSPQPISAPSCVHFIPFAYLRDILGDLLSSPAFIAALDKLLPTHRSLLISPQTLSSTPAIPSSATRGSGGTNPNKYHNVFSFIYLLCYEKLHVISKSTLTQLTKKLITAFPTLIGGFSHVCTHVGFDIEDVGQLLLDLYLVRGLKQPILQQQVYFDLTLEQLFSKWTTIALKTQSKGKKDGENGEKSEKGGTEKSECYLKIGSSWSNLLSLRQNLLRSVLDLYGVDQIADKVMRKQQYLTKKKQHEYAEKFKHLTQNDDDGPNGDPLTASYAMKTGNNVSPNKTPLVSYNNNGINNNNINNSPNNNNIYINGSPSPHKTPILSQYDRNNAGQFGVDSDIDSRGGDFDDFSDDYDADDYNNNDYSDDDLYGSKKQPQDELYNNKANKDKKKQGDFLKDEITPLKQNQNNATPLKQNQKTPKLTRSPSPSSPNPSKTSSPLINGHISGSGINNDGFSPNKSPFGQNGSNLTNLGAFLKHCDEFDIDESRVFKEVDQHVLYRPSFAPRYTNSQQYLLQSVVQKGSLMDDITVMMHEYDTFQVSISIDEDGLTLVQIHPPRRNKVIEMNEDDHEYLEQQRCQQIIKQQHAKLIEKGLLPKNQKMDKTVIDSLSTQDLYQLMSDFGLATNNAGNIDDIMSLRSSNSTAFSGITYNSPSTRPPINPFNQPLTSSLSVLGSSTGPNSPFYATGGPNGVGVNVGDSVSIFSGRSGITLGPRGTMGSTTQRSLMLTSVTTSHTIKSLLSPAAGGLFKTPGDNSSNNGYGGSIGFLASPLSVGTNIEGNTANLPSPSGGASSRNTSQNGAAGVQNRSTKFTFNNTNTNNNSPTSQHLQNIPNSLSSPPPQSFSIIMMKIYQGRSRRRYNNYIHPNQLNLINLFEQQALSSEPPQLSQGQFDPFDDENVINNTNNDPQVALLIKNNPWGMVVTEGEGLSEWNPIEHHFFTIILRLLPLYPILIPFTHGFLPFLTSYQPSPYTAWAKLLHLLFSRRLGRRDFIIEGASSGNINMLFQSHQYEKINSILSQELYLTAQILFHIGACLERVLSVYEESHPTINLAKIYQNNGLIDSTSNEYNSHLVEDSQVRKDSIVTFGGYIHSIRSLYSLLKFAMGKAKQILHCAAQIENQRYLSATITFKNATEERERQLAKLTIQAQEDYQNELDYYNGCNEGLNPEDITIPPPEYQAPILAQVSPTMDEVKEQIMKSSIFMVSRGDIEDIAFQSYYLYQRHFAFSSLSLPTKGLHYQHHLNIAQKMAAVATMGSNGEMVMGTPDIDWCGVNHDTNVRSCLLLYPQNNIVAAQIVIHQQLVKQGIDINNIDSFNANNNSVTNVNTNNAMPPTVTNSISLKTNNNHINNLSNNSANNTNNNNTNNNNNDNPTLDSLQITTTPQGQLQLGETTIPLTPSLLRKIKATDIILSRLFPHYTPDPAAQLAAQNEVVSNPSFRGVKEKQGILGNGNNNGTRNNTSPNNNNSSTFCVSRLWIDFDLLYDCYTLANMLSIDLMMIDQDKGKIITTPSELEKAKNPLNIPRVINPMNIVLYYLDIFDEATLLQDSTDGLANLRIETDGVVVYSPPVVSPLHTSTIKRPIPQSNTFDIPEYGSGGDDYDDDYDDDDDDIRAITHNKSGAIVSNYDLDNNNGAKANKNPNNNAAAQFGSPTKRRPMQNGNRFNVAENRTPFVYDPDGLDDDYGDNDDDDNGNNTRPHLQTAHSTQFVRNTSPQQQNSSLNKIAHSPKNDFVGGKSPTPSISRTLSGHNGPISSSGDQNIAQNGALSSSKVEDEIEHETNDRFKCIELGDPDLLLFEYVKPLNIDRLDQFLIALFYDDGGKGTVFSNTLGGVRSSRPQQSTIGRVHSPSLLLSQPTGPAQQTSGKSQSVVQDPLAASDAPKKKKWFKF